MDLEEDITGKEEGEQRKPTVRARSANVAIAKILTLSEE
jgi:hypothetical protein